MYNKIVYLSGQHVSTLEDHHQALYTSFIYSDFNILCLNMSNFYAKTVTQVHIYKLMYFTFCNKKLVSIWDPTMQ